MSTNEPGLQGETPAPVDSAPAGAGHRQDYGAPPEIDPDDFARRFSLRAGNLMWLLGAGASASAGIPTAQDMIWDFKQQLFVSQRKVAPQTVADLSNPTVRAQLQAHIDSSERLPAAGDPEEYAALFETVYPAEADRRAYIDAKIAGAKPSYGHLALATLMCNGLTRLVWTTNFDPLVADACAKVYGTTGALTTVDLDAPELAAQVIADGRWPVEIKLHGDFRSRRLKNTNDELRHQDVRLRQVFVDSCRRFGLVVAGYSGRDDSIMDALEEALRSSTPFPAGLYWLHKGDTAPLPRVITLLEQAVQANVEAVLVRIENFDEALRDLIRLIPDMETTILSSFAEKRRRWSPAPRPSGRRGWPVVRLNALPVIQAPAICRLVVCEIGGYAELRQAIARAGTDLVVARIQRGVLAFGADTDVRTTFEPYLITDFSLYTLESSRLRNESGERGLLGEGLTRALSRNCGLDTIRRGRSRFLAPIDPRDRIWSPLRRLVGELSGTVKGYADLRWREGICVRLDWAHDRLWLVFEPRTIFDGMTDLNKAFAADFARERTVKRYNRRLNHLIEFWAEVLAQGGEELRTFGMGNGVDAVFRLSKATGFSRRAFA